MYINYIRKYICFLILGGKRKFEYVVSWDISNKKIDFQKRLWPCGGRRPKSDPAGGVFGSLFFYISIYDDTCSKFYSSVCSTTGST